MSKCGVHGLFDISNDLIAEIFFPSPGCSWTLVPRGFRGVIFPTMGFPPGSNFSPHSSGSQRPLWILCPSPFILGPTSLQLCQAHRNPGILGAFFRVLHKESVAENTGRAKGNVQDQPPNIQPGDALNPSGSRVA